MITVQILLVVLFVVSGVHLDGFKFTERQAAMVNHRAAGGTSPFLMSARQGSLEMVQLLLKYGADVNLPNDEGNTPLHVAFCEGHWDIFQELVKHGADIKIKNAKGNTPLETVCDFNIASPRMDDFINAQNNDGDTPLHLGSNEGHKDIAELLLTRDADPKLRNIEGKTPLHLAAQRGHVGVTQVLLQHEANVNAKNAEGKTALHLAYEQGHMEIVDLLKKNGANIDAKFIEKNFNKLVKNFTRFEEEL